MIGRGYVAEQPPMRCLDAASIESRPTGREAIQQKTSHTLQRLPVGTVTQVHKERWWSKQTFDDLLKFIFYGLKLPEADNRLPVWTPQHGQSETTEETATPTHSKNSIQNQSGPKTHRFKSESVCFVHLYKRNLMIEQETGNWPWWGASAKCAILIKVTNIITMCSLTFLNPQIKNPLSSCTSLSRLTSCSVNQAQENTFLTHYCEGIQTLLAISTPLNSLAWYN